MRSISAVIQVAGLLILLQVGKVRCYCSSSSSRGSTSKTLSYIIPYHIYERSSHQSSFTSLYAERRGTELSKYKTRSAILQHTLEKKQNESILLKQKLKILQDVVQRLQKSNKSLLEKLEHLQREKDGIHVKDSDTEVWPPDMQIQLIKDDFDVKEAQWKSALRIGHAKYLKAKEDNKRLTAIIDEREQDIKFYAERAKVDESATNLLQEQISIKDNLIKELEQEIAELKENIEMSAAAMKENDQQREILESNVSDRIEQLSLAQDKIKLQEEQLSLAKSRLTKLGDRWKTRREEMQRIIEKKSQEIASLREQFERIKVEKLSLQDSLNSAQQEIDLLRSNNITNETLAGNLNAEEKSWMESIEIASVAVQQAEEREKKLRQELDQALQQRNDAKEDVNKLTKRVQELEAMEEKNMSIYHEASKDYVSQIETMKNEIADMTRKLETAANSSLLIAKKACGGTEQNNTVLSGISDDANIVEEIKLTQVKHQAAITSLHEHSKHDNVFSDHGISDTANASTNSLPKRSNGRLRRLVKRIKSIWRKDSH